MQGHNALYIIGPTASGKSDLAVRLAHRYNGVVINADSMQIYQGANIITAIPDTTAQQGIVHMLYAYVPALESFNVIQWRTHAINRIYQVLNMGKIPILCGGTGLYASAMTRGLSPIPPIAPNVRTGVRNMHTHAIYAALQKEDPMMAKRLKSGDTQRMARALEIIRSTGTSLAHYQDLPPVAVPDDIRIKMIALMPDRQIIYNRINSRYAHMFDNGAVQEVQNLLHMGMDKTAQIYRAIGVGEIVKYIQGAYDKNTAITHGKTATRRYAKRQYTYIRNQLHPHIIIDDINTFDNSHIF